MAKTRGSVLPRSKLRVEFYEESGSGDRETTRTDTLRPVSRDFYTPPHIGDKSDTERYGGITHDYGGKHIIDHHIYTDLDGNRVHEEAEKSTHGNNLSPTQSSHRRWKLVKPSNYSGTYEQVGPRSGRSGGTPIRREQKRDL